MTRYLIVIPAVLIAAVIALYAWAAYDLQAAFADWEESYS